MRRENRRDIFLVLGLVLGLIFFIVIGFWLKKDKNLCEKNRINKEKDSIDFEYNYEEFNRRFYQTDKGEKYDGDFFGLVVPHHLVADKLIGRAFDIISNQKRKINRIVLVGPNHFEKGDKNILGCDKEIKTEVETLYSEEKFYSKLCKNGLTEMNCDVIINDHSIGNIIPFVGYYFDSPKIVSIVLKKNTDRESLDELSKLIGDFIEKEGVLIGSIDFSHYLKRGEADKMDEESLKMVEGRDYEQILISDNDHFDCPPCLYLVLKTMDEIGVSKIEVFDHTNSGYIQNNAGSETTSYFTLGFNK